jgi:dUTP pyrophosphatase
MPWKENDLEAGYDFSACLTDVEGMSVTIPAWGRKIISTGLAVAVPHGYYGRIAPRSGLAAKHGLDVGAGVVDETYRGLISIILFNLSDQPFTVHHGDRIAQMVIEKVGQTRMVLVDELPASSRGDRGFGSSGLRPARNGAENKIL